MTVLAKASCNLPETKIEIDHEYLIELYVDGSRNDLISGTITAFLSRD
jgi:hypothetical protein